MKELDNVRVRHAMLFGVYVQLKNYLECLNRGYLGDLNDFEKKLSDELKDTLLKVESTCWDYFDKEERILEG